MFCFISPFLPLSCSYPKYTTSTIGCQYLVGKRFTILFTLTNRCFCKKWLGEHLGSVWAVSRPSLTTPFFRRIFQFFWAVFGQFSLIFGWFLGSFGAKKDRLDCPIGLCKLLIFRFLTFLNLLILLLVKEEILL